MKSPLFILLLTGLCHLSLAQNLIPNPSFETIEGCFSSQLIPITVSPPWYPIPVDSAGNLFVADPDFFHPDCPHNLQSNFWDPFYEAYDGLGYGGFIGGLTNNGFFLSEGMGVPLTQELEAGEAYYLQAQVRSKGTRDGWGGFPCTHAPDRKVHYYASQVPTRMEVRYSNGSDLLIEAKVNGTAVMIDSSAYLNSVDSTEWNLFCDCFVAAGGEQQLAIAGPVGFAPSPCTEPGNSVGYAKVFYYDFDDLSLVKMPKELEATTAICEEVGSWVHLRDFVPMPMFGKAHYRWADGCTDSIRWLTDIGFYEIDVIMPCTSIPLYLTVDALATDLCPEPLPLIADTSIRICGNEQEAIFLRSLIAGQFTDVIGFEWEDGRTDSIRMVEESGLYAIDVYTLCRKEQYAFELEVQNCETQLFVPNVFSPNDDGRNDELQIFLNAFWEVNSMAWKIFDRWGNLLFATQNPDASWDGTKNGTSVASGIYVWTLEYVVLERGIPTTHRVAGDVLLLR